MRLLRIGAARDERPAVLIGDTTAVDVSSILDDFHADFFGHDGIAQLRGQELAALPRITLDGVFVGPPVELSIDQLGAQRQCVVAAQLDHQG